MSTNNIDDLAPTVSALGTILSIWAHPDDETYLAGGLMAAAVDNGQRVVCVWATAGELGTADPAAWPPDRVAATRVWESRAAMAALGVTEQIRLGYPDGRLATTDAAEPVSRLAGIIASVQADTILTFGPDGSTFHPDHCTLSRWVDAAWWAAGCPGRLLHAAASREHLHRWGELYDELGVFMTDERPTGVPERDLLVSVRLDGAALDRKCVALLAMHSQVGPLRAAIGEAQFRGFVADEGFVAAAQREARLTLHAMASSGS